MSKKNQHIDKETEKLIADLKKGKAEAFQMLYKKYSQKLYRFCLRMLGDEEQARDAYQETFIKVYEHRKDFTGTNFVSWMFTIARHNCLNTIRSRKDHDQFNETFHGGMYSMDVNFGLKEQIEKAIEMVPVILREALILREYEQYTYQEIADILDIDISLAKVRVYRARLLLRKLLKPLVKELNES